MSYAAKRGRTAKSGVGECEKGTSDERKACTAQMTQTQNRRNIYNLVVIVLYWLCLCQHPLPLPRSRDKALTTLMSLTYYSTIFYMGAWAHGGI